MLPHFLKGYVSHIPLCVACTKRHNSWLSQRYPCLTDISMVNGCTIMPTVPALAVVVASTRGQQRSSFPGFCYAAAPGIIFPNRPAFQARASTSARLRSFPRRSNGFCSAFSVPCLSRSAIRVGEIPSISRASATLINSDSSGISPPLISMLRLFNTAATCSALPRFKVTRSIQIVQGASCHAPYD